MTDVIAKHVVIAAPPARVYRALTDPAEFGTWFRVQLDGPFVPGEETRGRMTYPGYEGEPFLVSVVAMEPDRRFAFRWIPGVQTVGEDRTDGARTLVEFALEPAASGTALTLRETGFDGLPADTRVAIMRENDGGWTEQLGNLERHVGG